MKEIFICADKTDSATEHKAGSSRPTSACMAEIIDQVGEMIQSQEGARRTCANLRETAPELNIGRSSVHRIAKTDLKLTAFR